MAKRKKQDSPVVQFVVLAWENAGGNPHSWEAYNHQVREAVYLALRGFEWEEGDVDEILRLSNNRYSIAKCLGELAVEGMYSRAVWSQNVSAYVELERYLDRAPVIADNVTDRNNNLQARGRLSLGASFDYTGGRRRVTSFGDDGRAVTVPVAGRRTIVRIGPVEIKADRAARKKAKNDDC